jgi:hypothetical protein
VAKTKTISNAAVYNEAIANNAAPNTARGFFAPKSIACRNHTKP